MVPDARTWTILVTDIVGSTEMRVRLGEQRADAIRRVHEDHLRVAVAAADGKVVKGLGDGILAMFTGAADAVAAAVRIQQDAYTHSRETPDEALEVRVGLSAGDVTLENDDCFGTPVVEAARLCGAAVGGQILAAEVVRVLARGRGGHVFTAAGERELKGLPDPIPVAVVGWDPPDPVAGRAFPVRLLPQGVVPFCGRGAQFELLVDEWKQAASGERRVVLLSGEPGIGKTRLAAEVARRAHDLGAMVLFGRSDEDLGVPYQPFVEALEQVVQGAASQESLGRHAGELVRLMPELAELMPGLERPLSSDPETERYRLFDAVASWLGTASEPSGLVLVLDDLHWAEKPTLLLLRHLVRSAEPMRLLVIGTYRDTDLSRTHPLSEVLADLRREPVVQRVALSGLDVDGVSELLAKLSGERTDGREGELAGLLWSETEGNPFFVAEILASLVESGRLVQRDGVWTSDLQIDELAIPEGIREVIGRRLTRLSSTANAVLSVASVIGSTVDVDVLILACGLEEDAVLDALDEASGAALVRELPTGEYEFTHALVRTTLYDELSAARRARRHRQIAELLEVRGTEPATLAYHFGRSGPPDSRMIEYAVAAGDRAVEQLAFDQAVAFFLQALETADDLDIAGDRRADLLIRLGEAERLSGRPEYRETLLGAADLARRLGDADLLARAALANTRGYFGAVGYLDRDRVEVLNAALDAVGDGDSPTRARLMSVLAAEVVFGDRELHRVPLADEALAMARRLDDEACLLQVWAAHNFATWVPERVSELVAELPALVELADRVGDSQQIMLVALGGLALSFEVGDIGLVDLLLARMRQVAAEANNPFLRWTYAACRATRLMVGATGDEVERAATETLQLGQEAGQPDAFTAFATQFAFARLLQGRVAEIIELVKQQSAEDSDLPQWRAALAANLARAGERDEARGLVDDLMTDPETVFPSDFLWLVGQSYLGEAVSAVGTPDQAARLYQLLVPYAGRLPASGVYVRRSVSLDLATLAARAGWPDRAEWHFAETANQHLRLDAPIWLAETYLRWGQFLLDGEDTERARAHLTKAHDLASKTACLDIAAIASAMLGGGVK